jgi:hypothetical protein
MDLNPRPPTSQEMPNFFIFVGIIHIIRGLKFEPVSRQVIMVLATLFLNRRFIILESNALSVIVL